MTHIKFKGKNLVVNHHLVAPYHTLTPKRDLSVVPKNANVSLHDNLILHGDNLLALKALLPTHAGKVNCIYIDPPYNTGNEKWCYNDNVKNPMMQAWLGKTVDREDLTRHDKWLCMMYPRLTLLHELLAEDGVILISIDDNEVHRLRMLMDEIFGEDNFIETLIWKKKGGAGNNETYIGDILEYIVMYSKNKQEVNLNFRFIENVSYPVQDEEGFYKLESLTKTDKGAYNRETMKFGVINPDTGKEITPPKGKRWVVGKPTMNDLLEADFLVFVREKGEMTIKKKVYYDETDPKTGVFLNLLTEKGSLKTAKDELENMGFPREFFDTPKPSLLIKHILRIATDKNALILDSFAGSGTTAHAVLRQNKEDGGNRKFILIECEDYANHITAERVRRVIKGVNTAKNENLKIGFGGGFSYFVLGDAIEMKSILGKKGLPSYEELARYIFFTATGEQWNAKNMEKSKNYIGNSHLYEVYLLYTPDATKLKEIALTLDGADALPKPQKGKTRLVFAPVRYININELQARNIKYCQLPFEIYRMVESRAKKSRE